jgi:hypothetical protein
VLVEELKDDGVLDLNRLAALLAAMLDRRAPLASEGGKERLCWTVTLMLGCTQDVALQLVNALILRRQLVLRIDRSGCEVWRIAAPPAAC